MEEIREQKAGPKKVKRPLDIVGGLVQHLKLILIIFVLGSGAVLLISNTQSNLVYTTESVILLEPFLPEILYPGDRNRYLHSFEDWSRTQVMVLKSHPVLEDALQQYEEAGYNWQKPGETRKSAVDRLRALLQVVQIHDTQIMTVGITLQQKGGIDVLVNSIIRSYIQFLKRERIEEDENKLKYLYKERDQYNAILAKSYDDLERISRMHGAAIADEKNFYIYLDAFVSLQSSYHKVVLDRIRSENSLNALARQKTRLDDLDLSSLKSPEELNDFEDRVRLRIMGLNEGTAQYEELRSVLENIDSLKHAIARQMLISELDLEIEDLRSQFEAASNNQKDVEVEIQRTQEELMRFNTAVLRASTKRQEIERYQGILNRINDRIEQIEIEKFNPGRVFPQAWALPPDGPDPSSRMKKIVVGILGSLIIGIAIAIGLEFMDNTVKRPADIRKALGFPVTGFLLNAEDDNIPEEDIYQLFKKHPRSFSFELFHQIALRIDKDKREKDSRVFGFMSPRDGNGATSVALNLLALVDAPARRRIYIDLNQRDPLTKRFPHLAHQPGLSDWLDKRATLDDCMYTGEEFPFPILAQGTLADENLQMIHFSSVKRLIDELKNHFDYIFLETPPLLMMSQSQKLALICDVVVLVPEAHTTTWPELGRSVGILNGLRINALAVILNRITILKTGYFKKTIQTFYSQHDHGQIDDHAGNGQKPRKKRRLKRARKKSLENSGEAEPLDG